LNILKDELKSYKTNLLKKKHLVAANKIDMVTENGEDRERIETLKKHCRAGDIPYLEISALKEIHLKAFKQTLFELYHGA
jgi:GTPase involved in cell partitioning and DNA repair